MQLSTRKFLNYIKEAINYRRRSLSHFNGSAPSSGSGDLFSPGALPSARPRARVPPCTPTPTSQPCVPPGTLTSHLAHSPGAPHAHIPPCSIASVPSYPTPRVPPVPHTLISHLAHSYPPLTHSYPPLTHSHPTPHPRIPPHALISVTSNPTPRTPHPAPLAPVTPRTFPVPVGAWGQASGVALSCCPLPGPIPWPLARGPWHCRAGDPHPSLPKPPHSTGAPSPGRVSPVGAPHGSPVPGGLRGPWGPFWGAGAGGTGGGPGLPRRAWPLISCLTGSLGSAAEKHSQTSRSSRGALNPCLAAPHAGGAPRPC